MFHELKLAEFADAFAQMLAYGLFLARLNAEAGEVTLNNAREHIPGSFRLIRELVDFLTELEKDEYREIRWVVEEVLSIVNGLDLAAIHEDLSFRQRRAISRDVRAQDEEEHRLFERDPFIYFYEDYLKAYDPEMRKGRGVYYTPPPIVNFIIRAVDDVLKDTFGIADGLADHQRVTVLDFACGTGTFLLEVFQRIFENIGGADSGRGDLIVREHILRNLYGFEYLIAPYTIAHLKLSQYLHEQGHALRDDERLQIFLTNTLEPVEPQANLLLPAVSAEVEAAQAVKDQPVLVITGNPPYAARSRNRGAWITTAVNAYKMVDGKHFGEKKHWLHDDYVKFLRFAQIKMDTVEEGIVGVITNHSWLDNPTFRGMRQSLMQSFQQIYVLDLHGNVKKKERAPDQSKDDNIFDIEQGVAISLFVKRPNLERGIWRGDIWGNRLAKYKAVAHTSLKQAVHQRLRIESPQYLFKHVGSGSLAQSYQRFQAITEIFAEKTPGVITARDRFAICFTREELVGNVKALIDPNATDRSLGDKFKLKDTRGWSLHEAREALRNPPDWMNTIQPILQAPFDIRFCPHDIRLIDWGRWKFYSRLSDKTLSLCVPRKIDIQRPWEHIFASVHPISHHAVSMKEVNYQYPIQIDNRENLSPDFREYIDGRYDHHYSPEEILGYIYAVLHAPTYRERYAEFLRIDFPRIPFPESAEKFERLSALGWELVQAHVEREFPRRRLGGYAGQGSHEVERVRFSPEEQSIWINADQRFENIPSEVWEFYIGGYQVIGKYLKSRKGRTLSLDEINHVGAIADILAFTIDLQGEIDAAYGEAFPDA